MSQLDVDQTRIAEHKTGPALVLAGAGSGKTTSIIERAFNNIMTSVCSPQEMVLMTFTNKAAFEMRMRLMSRLKEKDYDGRYPLITTYHSFGHRLLRKNPEACFRKEGLSLLDDKDATSLKREIFGMLFEKQDLKPLMKVYDLLRNEGLDPNANFDSFSIKDNYLSDEELGFSEQQIDDGLLAFQEYEHQKEFLNVVDFDDLVNLPIKALTTNPEFRALVASHIKDITIDEAQDNNAAQYKLLKLLCNGKDNQTIVMIGDDDQSIHRWRGAHPEKINTFIEEYKPQVFLLEKNYRSSDRIVSHATDMIRKNSERLEKNPYSARENSANLPINLDAHDTGVKMAESIARQIKKSIDSGTQVDDIAVLYRTNRMSRLLEPPIMALGIPYYVKKGTELLEFIENKMMISACRLAVNPRDRMAFKYIAQIIPGLGDQRFDDMMEYMDQNSTPRDLLGQLPEKARQATREVLDSLDIMHAKGPEKIYAWAIGSTYFKDWLTKRCGTRVDMDKPTGFDSWMKQKQGLNLTPKQADTIYADGTEEVDYEAYQGLLNISIKDRLTNMKMVQQSISFRVGELSNISGEPTKDININDQWSEAMEVILRPPDGDDNVKRITLSSIHSAKGLEWDTVHVAGFSEGILPLKNNEGEVSNLIEERCLAYVAMTRAKDNLHLHHAKRIDLQNGSGNNYMKPSRFISEAGLKMDLGKNPRPKSKGLIKGRKFGSFSGRAA